MSTTSIIPVEKRFKPFKAVESRREPSILTGIAPLDAFWSTHGGIVIGSSIFMTGTSGAGKTTLSAFLMKVLNKYKTALWSREMASSAVKEQTSRMNIDHDNALIADDETCPTYIEFLESLDYFKPKFVIVDSLQVVAKGAEFSEQSESDVQYRIIQELRKWANENDAVLIMIGHNKKDGEFRGDNTIMQMFDAHLEMIHHKNGDYRTLSWGQKNRKGPLSQLYYEFVASEEAIKFYTPEEWEVNKKGTTLTDMLDSTIELYVSSFKNHKNFKDFKKEFSKEYNKIDDSIGDLQVTTQVIMIISTLVSKHFDMVA